MIGSIRKHQNWLWAVIITITIVSFVFFFSPAQKLGGGSGGNVNFGSINGKPITREQISQAAREANLFYFLRHGEWPGRDQSSRQNGFDEQRQAYDRIVLIEKLKEMKIEPTTESVAQWVSDIFRGNSDQPFNPEIYQRALKEHFQPHGISAEDFERFARHEVGQQHLISLFGLSGRLVTPQEAESLYRRENEAVSTEAVFFGATNYLATVSAPAATLGQYYTNHMAEYRLQERVAVKYIRFDKTNFLKNDQEVFARLKELSPQMAQMPDLSQAIEAIYANRGTNIFKDEKGNPLTPEASKDKIKTQLRDQIALSQARKTASEFINQLFELQEKNPQQRDTLEKLAASKKLTVKETSLFDEQNGPKEIKVPFAFSSAAFRLSEQGTPADPTPQLYSTTPIEAEDGVYVLGFKQRVPSQIQPLETIKEKVTEDYRLAEARKLARQAGEKFAAAAAQNLSQGKTFKAIAEQEKVKPVSIPPFSLNTRSLPDLEEKVSLNTLQNVVSHLAPKKSSDFVATPDGGLVLYLDARLPVDEPKLKSELPIFIQRVRESRQYAAYFDWFERQKQEMRLVAPMASTEKKR